MPEEKTVTRNLKPIGYDADLNLIFHGSRVAPIDDPSQVLIVSDSVYLSLSSELQPMQEVPCYNSPQDPSSGIKYLRSGNLLLIDPPVAPPVSVIYCEEGHLIVRTPRGYCPYCEFNCQSIRKIAAQQRGLSDSNIRYGHDLPVLDWGLDMRITPADLAAHYYALSYLAKVTPDKYETRFQDWCQEIAEKIYRYTYMVVGGELRHAYRRGAVCWASNNLPQSLYELLDDVTDQNRTYGWKQWMGYKDLPEEEMLEWAAQTFEHFRKGGYGGPSWARIARLAKDYKTKTISPAMFLDTAWGLHHNGNVYFDKLYPLEGLDFVLRAGYLTHCRTLSACLPDGELKSDLLKALGLSGDTPYPQLDPFSQTYPVTVIVTAKELNEPNETSPVKNVKPKTAKSTTAKSTAEGVAADVSGKIKLSATAVKLVTELAKSLSTADSAVQAPTR